MSPLSGITSSLPGNLTGVDFMQARVAPLPSPAEVGKTQETGATQPAGDSFSSMLGRMVSEVNNQQNVATQAVSALQSGQKVPLHQTVIAMEEANVSFQLMVEVRNRLLDAYQEIMRMSI